MQVSTCSNGKYRLNQENVFISLPVELGDQGVKRIVEIDLDETEQQKVTNLRSAKRPRNSFLAWRNFKRFIFNSKEDSDWIRRFRLFGGRPIGICRKSTSQSSNSPKSRRFRAAKRRRMNQSEWNAHSPISCDCSIFKIFIRESERWFFEIQLSHDIFSTLNEIKF